jgi:hypothetical protein
VREEDLIKGIGSQQLRQDTLVLKKDTRSKTTNTGRNSKKINEIVR